MFISVTRLSRSVLRIIKISSVYRLQSYFVNNFIVPIGLIWFTTSNVIHLLKYMRGIVYLKCCSKWAVDVSDFCLIFVWFWEGAGHQINNSNIHSFIYIFLQYWKIKCSKFLFTQFPLMVISKKLPLTDLFS